MTYEIVKYANAPKLEKITFLCDIPIRSKLKKIDVINHFFNKANITCVVGRQGSGKTSILMNFVKIYKCFII
jgi:ABC-type cobalamin/Fe3+-siderophores transport system ATPase subunit